MEGFFPSLAAKRKANKRAEAAIAKLKTEEDVLQHLLDTKPAILCCGKDNWLDKPNIEEDIKGYVERFIRKGLGDRSERLEYLQSTLRKKWSDQPQKFMSLMGLLLEMEDDSTNNYTRIDLSTKEYSELPDILIDKDADAKKQEEENLKRDLLNEIAAERENLIYSSDSDLSDWESDDNQSETEGKEKESQEGPHLAPEKERRIPLKKILGSSDSETEGKSVEDAWCHSGKEALVFLKQTIRQVKLTSLTNQPVISSPLDLQAKFGQFWEWKKWHKVHGRDGNPPNMVVISEGDIIREILWSFSHPSSLNSVIFSNDWTLKPKLMVSTLSHTALSGIVNKYGRVCSIAENLQKFLYEVEMNSNYVATSSQSPVQESSILCGKPPKAFQAFAHGISEILRDISRYVGQLENSLYSDAEEYPHNMEPKSTRLLIEDKDNHSRHRATVSVTTLVQLNKFMRKPILILNAIEKLFGQSIGEFTVQMDYNRRNQWFISVKLVSALEMALNVESRVLIWKIILFLFSNSLLAFLDEFMEPLRTTQRPPVSLFSWHKSLRLSDGNFWKNSITIEPYQEKLMELQIVPLSCLSETVPKMLSFLKVLEMLKQLEEDVTLIMGQDQVPPAKLIVQEFLAKILPTPFGSPSAPDNLFNNKNSENNFNSEFPQSKDSMSKSVSCPDYQRYFNFMKLNDRRVLGSFYTILKNEFKNPNANEDVNEISFRTEEECKAAGNDFLNLKTFLSVPEIPYIEISQKLSSAVQQYLNPVFTKGESSLRKIFHEYKVDESVSMFQEIILGGREDFAMSFVQLADNSNLSSSRFTYEDSTNRNPQYQRLLNDCYPEGRENFDIEFLLDSTSDLNYKFIVKPLFPLNLILTPTSIKKYLYVSEQLQRVRKSLWGLNNLQMKDCKTSQGVDPKRAFLLRFSLIYFCSGLRAFFILKIFTKNSTGFSAVDDDANFDQIINAHENYLKMIEVKLLKIKLMESIVIKKMISMSETLQKYWARGLPLNLTIKIEECLKQCWSIVNDFSRSAYSVEFSELCYHLGPPPSCLN